MIDREKVIKGLNHCFHGQECCGDTECPYYIECLSDACLEYCQEDLKADALALLKEQEDIVKELTDATELVHKKNARIIELIDLLKEQPEIVRCKDCVYHENEKARSNQTAWLPCMEMQTKNNWYCADGERKKKCVL